MIAGGDWEKILAVVEDEVIVVVVRETVEEE